MQRREKCHVGAESSHGKHEARQWRTNNDQRKHALDREPERTVWPEFRRLRMSEEVQRNHKCLHTQHHRQHERNEWVSDQWDKCLSQMPSHPAERDREKRHCDRKPDDQPQAAFCHLPFGERLFSSCLTTTRTTLIRQAKRFQPNRRAAVSTTAMCQQPHVTTVLLHQKVTVHNCQATPSPDVIPARQFGVGVTPARPEW